MKEVSGELIKRALKKGMKNEGVTHKVSCISFTANWNLLGITTNTFRQSKSGIDVCYKGVHAEQRAVRRWGNKIRYMFILRTNQSGYLKPICACKDCQEMADRRGIKIIPIDCTKKII